MCSRSLHRRRSSKHSSTMHRPSLRDHTDIATAHVLSDIGRRPAADTKLDYNNKHSSRTCETKRVASAVGIRIAAETG